MNARSTKIVRCAIYTRVSTDQGLEQDFNSLDAQHDAAQAYIRSQAHAGWSLLRAKYDDGGFSGGNTDRPALQRLLEDVRAGRVDVLVVYKVDRLTRSLADFAKLVELFDRHNVSFVSVTQQFNTTTSMGRLTLNVLLSFAQFEREVTSERIRDKIAASKRKGLWVGGMVPLGYETKDRKIVVVEDEAERVRIIFRRYLELGSLNLLMADLRERRIVTKVRSLSSGRTIGGIPFTRGPLAHLLRNRFYVGEVAYKDEVFPGAQPAIVDRDQFDAVQAKLDDQLNNYTASRAKSEALLIGRIYDDRGNRMSPSHARKQGVRYRYYISAPLLQGQAESAGSIPRVSAAEIEAVVLQAVRDHLKQSVRTDDRDLISTHLIRVEVHADHLAVELKAPTQRLQADGREPQPTSISKHGKQQDADDIDPAVLLVPWQKNPSKRRREIIVPTSASPRDFRPIRAETRVALVTSIARGRRWLDEIVTGNVTSAEQIAARDKCTVRQVNMTISLAFLAPDLVKAAVEGRLPRGIGIARLRDAPVEWSRQHAMLGLTS
jgi:DNA invertase Pin-like site-specific DNA recombinase